MKYPWERIGRYYIFYTVPFIFNVMFALLCTHLLMAYTAENSMTIAVVFLSGFAPLMSCIAWKLVVELKKR
jgi:hypothetical protein